MRPLTLVLLIAIIVLNANSLDPDETPSNSHLDASCLTLGQEIRQKRNLPDDIFRSRIRVDLQILLYKLLVRAWITYVTHELWPLICRKYLRICLSGPKLSKCFDGQTWSSLKSMKTIVRGITNIFHLGLEYKKMTVLKIG